MPIAIFFLALLLSGCATGNQFNGDQGELTKEEQIRRNVPINYQKIVADSIRSSLKDPYSVRDAEIAPPTIGWIGLVNGGNGTVVCSRFNAKNSFGAYIGKKDWTVVFQNGRVIGSVENGMACNNAGPYVAFPELMGGA